MSSHTYTYIYICSTMYVDCIKNKKTDINASNSFVYNSFFSQIDVTPFCVSLENTEDNSYFKWLP